MEDGTDESDSVEPRRDHGSASAPWSARPDETPRAYQVFRHWLGGERSERRLADAASFAGHKNKRTVEGWSAKHEWAVRARAYDEHRDDRVDAAAIEAREIFMRKMVRDRPAYQRSFHDALAGLGDVLGEITRDPEQSGSARVAAFLALVKQSGYTPSTPPEQEEGLGELVVSEILRMANVLSPEEAAVFTDLVVKSSAILEVQRAAGAGHEAD